MKILQTCGSASWGGLEMEVLKISVALRDLGHEVVLLCPEKSTLFEEAQKSGLKPVSAFSKGTPFYKTIKHLAKILRDENFDVIHCQLSHDLWTLVPAIRFRRYKAKFLMSKHVASRVKKKDIFHSFLYRRLDGIITISDFIRENVIDTCPVKPEKVKTIYNGIPDQLYNATNKDTNSLRSEYNIGRNTILVGLVGRLTLMKGHQEFLRAARIILDSTLAREKNDVLFLVIGGASYGEEAYETSIHLLAKELDLGDHLIFTGFKNSITEVMAELDILAFPSHKESFGNTLVEGMSMSLPVVASDSGAVPEIVTDGIEGYLVPPKNPEMLAEKLIDLIKSKEHRKIMGNAGRKKVGEKFLFSNFVATLEKIYKQ